MHASILTGSAFLRGKNFFAQPATLGFSPNPDSFEWTVEATDGEKIIIRPDIVHTKARRMVLKIDNTEINIPEHILAARFSNILGVSISSSAWPPYHGRALEALSSLTSAHRAELYTDFPAYTVSKEVYFQYEEVRGPEKAFTSIAPSTSGKLTLKIVCAYKGLGRWQRIYVLPDDALLIRICSAHAQGWPPWLFHPSNILRKIGLWPHHKHVTWIQEHDPEEARDLFSLHRAQDLLGALALLCRDGMFTGTISSYYSGHKADLAAVTQADAVLERVWKS